MLVALSRRNSSPIETQTRAVSSDRKTGAPVACEGRGPKNKSIFQRYEIHPAASPSKRKKTLTNSFCRQRISPLLNFYHAVVQLRHKSMSLPAEKLFQV